MINKLELVKLYLDIILHDDFALKNNNYIDENKSIKVREFEK